ncbi:hypothetical protein J1G44_09205 [Cellulomonas sp. zg-ZUI199]|uniref:Restriction endonuclease n=1 Tax=Cellulomonas wangleii TaxID=2816956 RepID=A0ABX8D5W3_9CELL|nr:hypothetical protein [Cellulomonas wangleii]MBO0924661.1 hypothetical protein [Cellulomonas wangleii]QVI62850.1 hypothetical protein KG103_02610 [Cellulomonas wangleii]
MVYLDKWGISLDELDALVAESSVLRGMVYGFVAEFKLRTDVFESDPRIINLVKPADSNRVNHRDKTKRMKGDLNFTYRNQQFKVETKSLDTASCIDRGDGRWGGTFQCNGSDKREIEFDDGTTLETNLLLFGQFDLVAVSLFGFGEHWHYAFAKNSDLTGSTWHRYTPAQQRALIASSQKICEPLEWPFRSEPWSLLDEIIEERARGVAPEQTMDQEAAESLDEHGELDRK